MLIGFSRARLKSEPGLGSFRLIRSPGCQTLPNQPKPESHLIGYSLLHTINERTKQRNPVGLSAQFFEDFGSL